MKRLALAILLTLAVSPALAQQRPLLNLPRGPIGTAIEAAKESGAPSGGLPSLIGAFDDKLLPDLKYAYALVEKSDDPNDKLTAACWSAWIDRIEQRKQAILDEQGNPVPLPEPHVISEFQRILLLRNSLRAGSKFMLACQPVASLVRQDIQSLVGLVAGGGAGLLRLVPGL